ncbi:hypothetical protein DFH08DRAFT_1080408 [Mycena albidolilacea]|uniref:Extracellular membrane protein CFEM domain-containing protein n=1 Tax=Mycena albidolilacea TaxID=1033008 RepID=A0AAD7A205_9AGAR|nr:hypothetical protein DFH08DRAFT_1080408 [Mycena albidolilacea]
MRFAVTAVRALAAAVCAHLSQGPPAPPPSSFPVLGCLTAAANATEYGSPANVTCACTNADFQFNSTSYLQAECKAEELAAAVGLQQQQRAPRECCSCIVSPRPPHFASLFSISASPPPFASFNPAADISGALSSADSSGSGYKLPSATPAARCRSLRPTPGRDSCSARPEKFVPTVQHDWLETGVVYGVWIQA